VKLFTLAYLAYAVQSSVLEIPTGKVTAMNWLSWNGKMFPADKVKLDGYTLGLDTITHFLNNGTITRYSSRGGYLNFHTTGTAGKAITK
jgi:hypothetical protein